MARNQDLPPAPETPPKRVLIVDDHPVFRAGLIGLVRLEPGLCVCGEATNAAETLTAIDRLHPDLVLMDMGLPDKSGLELLKDVRAMHPDLPVLIISMHDETLFAERVLRAGGRGYLMKQEGPDQILLAIRRVLAGQIYVSERTSAAILDHLAGGHPRVPDADLANLSDREFEVMRLLGQGLEPREIAEKLHLSIKTVDSHRLNIKTKLGLRNNTELVHRATRWVTSPS